ncbi:unnamed protein product [Owenia fusiformis]|uniref:Uncharacterized protein n=1 Tax=Owenia fusiformis TaxID=6347 RepID=A0A8S4PD86_OWEFU|nr:unnamed protein product [Owenia fusiformis]
MVALNGLMMILMYPCIAGLKWTMSISEPTFVNKYISSSSQFITSLPSDMCVYHVYVYNKAATTAISSSQFYFWDWNAPAGSVQNIYFRLAPRNYEYRTESGNISCPKRVSRIEMVSYWNAMYVQEIILDYHLCSDLASINTGIVQSDLYGYAGPQGTTVNLGSSITYKQGYQTSVGSKQACARDCSLDICCQYFSVNMTLLQEAGGNEAPNSCTLWGFFGHSDYSTADGHSKMWSKKVLI